MARQNAHQETAPMKNVLVTGTSGYMGTGIAQVFELNGYHVIGVDRVEPESNMFSGQHVTHDLGMLDSENPLTLPVNELEHVVAVAGGALSEEVKTHEKGRVTLDTEVIVETFRVNYLTALETLEMSRPLMSSGGSITLISSINALGGYGLPIYSSAKAALHGLMSSMAPSLWGNDGIRLNVVALGTVKTARTVKLHGDDPEHFEKLQATTDRNELLTPHRVGEHILDVAQHEELWGEIITVDNGQLGNLRSRQGKGMAQSTTKL